MRDYEIHDNTVLFLFKHPYKNHSKTHYKTRQVWWRESRSKKWLKIMGVVWRDLGIQLGWGIK